MSNGWGQFHLTTGRVVVGDDAVRIRSTPRDLLAGQVALFRQGGAVQRLKVLARVAAALLAPVFVVITLYQVVAADLDVQVVTQAATLVAATASLWHRYGRETRIPIDAIREVTIGAGDRRFEIVYDRRHGPFSWYLEGPGSKSRRFRTAADARRASEILQARGIEGAPEADDGPTTYRVETRKGVVFCEECGSQVSPNDRRCPACDYALRSERRAEGP